MTLGTTPQEAAFNRQILGMMGFTNREINAFDEAVDQSGKPQPPINLGSEDWRKVIEERQQWIQELQDSHIRSTGKKFTARQVGLVIDSFYDRDPNFSPWDWLKKEYQKSKPNGHVIDYIEAARQRALAHTSSMRSYSRKF